MRVDAFMVENGLAPSRERAKELIKKQQVTVNSRVCVKPSANVGSEDKVEVTGETLRYVGRGGLKLEKIIEKYSLDLSGKTCMDVGASTGGFTDCMLQSGAGKVYAVDVGSGQLAQKLLEDSRVVNMEKTDIRDLSESDFPEKIDFISADVSFISLKLVLPHIRRLISPDGQAAVLIKPQFEAGRENVGKNGIVRSKKVHERVLSDIYAFACGLGFKVIDVCCSPVTGAKGNIEYLIYMDCSETESTGIFDFKEIADDAFSRFGCGGK
ncbi:MAG: TlyA family RNA methyltransferase [Porcipelethomonas sp.]